MTYFMASALVKGLQLASRILQASWLELIYDPLIIPVFSDPEFYMTLFKCSLGRSQKTGISIFKIKIMALNIQWMFRPLEIEHTTTALAI
jgi:hypothetical protein